MVKKIISFFDKLEDKVRAKLSHMPLLYAFLGGTGIVLFWRGIWHLADEISMSSFISALLGSAILLITGVFVSSFVGSRIIMSGLLGEKKLVERTEEEIETEESQIKSIRKSLVDVEKELEVIEKKIDGK